MIIAQDSLKVRLILQLAGVDSGGQWEVGEDLLGEVSFDLLTSIMLATVLTTCSGLVSAERGLLVMQFASMSRLTAGS